MTEEIISSIIKTTREIKNISSLPNQQGIYAFFLNETGDLAEFGSFGQVIYIGLAEKSLNSRDIKSHLENGQTGWSSFRRSVSAILKVQLNLTAQKRDKNSIKLRPDKYKFDEDGEKRLTQWMIKNLKMGFWTTDKPLSINRLRKEEENVILMLKPTLDLDKRTKKFNYLADNLDSLRKVCREEVKSFNKI
jgi:hypothetical protein